MNRSIPVIVRFARVLCATAMTLMVTIPASSAASQPLPRKSFFSTALHKNIEYFVYLPPDYDSTGRTRYPVLYLLHGRGDNMTAWTTVVPDLDHLISGKQIPAIIAIMPDAPSNRRANYYIDSQFTGDVDSSDLSPGEPVESAFTGDLIAHVDGTYPTRTDRRCRIVAGYSMGGYGAMRYALAHPELFGAAIVLSPAVYVPLPPLDSSTREFGAFGRGSNPFDETVYADKNYPAIVPKFRAAGLPSVLFIAVGDDEHALPKPGESAHDLDYEAHTLYNFIRRVPGITAQLRVVDGGHNWDTWRPTFIEGIQYIFRGQQQTPHSVSSH